MFITRIVIISALLTLGACASSPQYTAADNADDYGHYSRKIAEDRYRVNFNGNSRTNYQDTRDFALLRAAELTLTEGYEWFQVVDRESATTETHVREPQVGFGYERATYVEQRCSLIGCSQRTRPTTAAYTSMHIDSRRAETSHRHSLEIKMGKGEMPDDGHYYDAESVVQSIYRSM